MPSKRLSNKSFERDASRLRVLMNNDFGGQGYTGSGVHFVPPETGLDITGGSALGYTATGGSFTKGMQLIEGNQCAVYGRLYVPSAVGAGGSATYKTIITYDGTGDIYCKSVYNSFACDLAVAHNGGGQSYAAVTLSSHATLWGVCVREHTATSLDPGDFLRVSFYRDATDAADTYAGGNVWVVGFQVTF